MFLNLWLSVQLSHCSNHSPPSPNQLILQECWIQLLFLQEPPIPPLIGCLQWLSQFKCRNKCMSCNFPGKPTKLFDLLSTWRSFIPRSSPSLLECLQNQQQGSLLDLCPVTAAVMAKEVDVFTRTLQLTIQTFTNNCGRHYQKTAEHTFRKQHTDQQYSCLISCVFNGKVLWLIDLPPSQTQTQANQRPGSSVLARKAVCLLLDGSTGLTSQQQPQLAAIAVNLASSEAICPSGNSLISSSFICSLMNGKYAKISDPTYIFCRYNTAVIFHRTREHRGGWKIAGPLQPILSFLCLS